MKKLNKKKVLTVCFCIIIIILSITILVTRKSNNNTIADTNIDDTETSEITSIKEEGYLVKKIENKFFKIHRIEVDSISIRTVGDELAIVTKIKNKFSEELDGFSIDIDLLDKEGNIVTSISQNSEEKIKKQESLELLNYAVGIENAEKIVSAKVTNLERGTVAYNVEKSLEQ